MNPHGIDFSGTQSHDLARLHARLCADTRSLSLPERQRLAQAFALSQAQWLARLQQLVEPPVTDDRFPAFLLDTAPFAALRQEIGDATERRHLSIGVVDALEHFIDAYRDYLHSTAGEQVFAESMRP